MCKHGVEATETNKQITQALDRILWTCLRPRRQTVCILWVVFSLKDGQMKPSELMALTTFCPTSHCISSLSHFCHLPISLCAWRPWRLPAPHSPAWDIGNAPRISKMAMALEWPCRTQRRTSQVSAWPMSIIYFQNTAGSPFWC